MQRAATLHQALLDFTFWQPGYSSGAIVYLHPMGGDYALGYGAAGNGSPVSMTPSSPLACGCWMN